MEPSLNESHPNTTEQNQDVNKTESSENFQKFIYELFDKNGILNDLRAYLRGHIVDVLKSAQTGDPPSCQRQFTQRLDSKYQALNILVAEYLLCMEFNYSLSVFVSEIPLANMLFSFAKSLMDLGADGEAVGLRFRDNDVWSILSYLGLKCDSEHASKIVEMYKTQLKSPLLLCILQFARLCDMEPIHLASSEEGSTSSKSSAADKRSDVMQCKHRAFCKACRGRYTRLKEKYRKKKTYYIQNAKANTKALNVETLMKNIGELERSLIDEMFEQLKTVYETEIDMYKSEHDNKIRNSLASHVKHFRRMQNELEQSFKAKEAALNENIVQKKRFLWGLAQALRVQHTQMTNAMQAVRAQTAEMADQEQNLKIQRTEAEESLKKHAEEMRQQIAEELLILERHLDTMKCERENINRDRTSDVSEIKMKIEMKNCLQDHYHLWKEELDGLKMYIENAGFPPKSALFVERSTNTDDKGAMNNEIDRGLTRDVRPNRVVNDLKKKNVNFSQCKLQESRCSDSSSSSDEERDSESRERQCLLQPLSAPLATQARVDVLRARVHHSLHETGCGWRKGAGEERSILPSSGILVPGDSIPFVGVVGRRSDSRRHLPCRRRAGRRAPWPEAAPLTQHLPVESAATDIQSPPSETRDEEAHPEEAELTPTRETRSKTNMASGSQKTREKSPRSVLKEAKEKLKTVTRASASREKSPSAVLREAKLRLRKLEIEAEAVERSYMDFRRRRELRAPDRSESPPNISRATSKLSTHHKPTPAQSKTQVPDTASVNVDMEKYLKKYQISLDLGQDRFKNRNTAAKLKNPVPEAYSQIDRHKEPVPKEDYLEKPILEFRKLYYTDPERVTTSRMSLDNEGPPPNISEEALKQKCSELRNEKDNKLKELEILKENISKIYDLQDEPTKDIELSKEVDDNISDNLLIVEVENVSEVRNLNVESETDMIVVVESSVDSKEMVALEHDESAERISTKMTIVVSPNRIQSEITSERRESLQRSPPTDFSRNIAKEFYEASGDKDFPVDVQIEIRNDPDSEIQIQTQCLVETEQIQDDYPDDFSYDVDNYKSDDNSPISLPKTSEDENFWD